MNYVDNLQCTIDYCENNLKHEISLEELATIAGYSVYHFCRLFQAVTCYAPMEYIRKRRLSQAAVELYNTKGYINGIGYKWGFNSHENFIRAFQKQFGISPSQYRESKSSLNLIHRIERINPPYCEDLKLAPDFIEKPSFILAGFSCYTTFEDGANHHDCPKHWNRYHASKLYDRIGIKVKPAERYDIGLITGNDLGNSSFTYTIGIEVVNLEGVNDDCVKIVVPSARYAVFRTPPTETFTFVKKIHATWDYIYHIWLPGTSFIHAGTHEFEIYCEESRTYSEEIWIPIGERKV